MINTGPPPEAQLIEQLRDQLPGRQSRISQVARQAGISEGRWRQIAKGYQQATKDQRVRVIAPADTLARMAAAVSATPEDLERVGRGDAAAELRKLQTAGITVAEHHAIPADGTTDAGPFAEVSTATLSELVKEIAAELRKRLRGPGPAPGEDGLL